MLVTPEEIVSALQNDALLDFRQTTNNTLRKGLCPACGKRELYISIANPFQLKCPRDNKCGYEESTRSRYAHLWEDLSNRAPATEQNPNATANAFLENRGFDYTKIQGSYSQQIRRFKTVDDHPLNADVLRFPLFDNHYWDRVINEKDIRAIGDKARISYGCKLQGRAWQMPGQIIEDDSTVFITEGIFHSLAFIYSGYTAIAAISSSNFPWQVIEQHKGRNIRWVIAYDDDKAGRNYAEKYYKQMEEKGETVNVALTGSPKDWDDYYKEGKLNKQFIKDSLWRGNMFTAKSIAQKAFYHYAKYGKAKSILDFDNKLWQITIQTDKLRDAIGLGDSEDQTDIEGRQDLQKMLESMGFEVFASYMQSYPISNCHPIFKYCESDKITGDIAYYFEIRSHKNASKQVAFSGSALESPSSFNKALLNRSPGSTFDGDARQMKVIREWWFNKGIEIVDTVPFIGYEKNSNIYIFPEFAYYQGRKLLPNEFGYFTQSQTRIKTTFKNIEISTSNTFDNSWFDDYKHCFSWNGLVVLAYWLGSLFAEQIRARHSSYPFLEMSGMPGTGKSTVLEFLWKCVGRDKYEGFDPSKASFAARTRAFIQVSNLPVVLIEGDRQKDAKKGGFDYNELKTAYNGRAVRAMGAFNRGNETIEPPFRGSIVIAQNEEVDADAAVMERICHLNFTKEHFTPQTLQISKRIDSIPIENVNGFLSEALSKEAAILHTFEKHYKQLETTFNNNGRIKNGRIIKNHAMLGALAHALVHLFPSMQNKQPDGNTLTEKLVAFIEYRGSERESRLISDHPLVTQFWETYELLEAHHNGDGGDTRLNHSLEPDVIAINLPHFYQVAAQYRFDLPRQNEIKTLLVTGTTHKMIAKNSQTKSAIWDGKNVKCWKFKTAKGSK